MSRPAERDTMTKNYKHLAFEGRAGQDCEMRYLDNGTAIASFSVATNDDYNDAGGQLVKSTTWLRVTAFGKLAEICHQYVKKGNAVIVEGWLMPDKSTGGPRIWNAQDGTPKTSYEVKAANVRFLSGREETTATGGAAPFVDEESVPF